MSTDELQTMYGSPLSELFAFSLDFIVFCLKSIYFFLEMLILTITPNRYRKLKVSHINHHQNVPTHIETIYSWRPISAN